MKNILVAFSTNSGSTEDVAKVIAEELNKKGNQASIRNIDEVDDITGYEAVVVGAPMILGWHRKARKFIKKHETELSRVPTAFFCTAMSLTVQTKQPEQPVPVYLDQNLIKHPKHEKFLGIKERYTLVRNYIKPILNSAPEVKPVSVAFFGGRLELYRLKLLQMLFVVIVIGAQPGDQCNWTAVREWASSLPKMMNFKEE